MEFNLQDQEELQKFSGHMAFGESGYSQQAEFVKIKDLNKKIIEVPYTDSKQTLSKLLSNYREVTSCNQIILNRPIYIKNSHKKRIYVSQDFLIQHLLPDFHNGEMQITLDDPSTMPEMLPESQVQACILIKGQQYSSHVDQGHIKVPMARFPFILLIKNQKGEKFELQNCDPQFTVQMVKQKIKDRNKIFRDQQILIYSGKQLQNYRRLKDYNIRQGSIVFLVKAYVSKPSKNAINTINVKTIKGTSLKLNASPYDLVKTLKEQIWCSEKIPVKEQKLFYGGTELSDYHTLIQQKLQNEAIVYLVMQSKGGCFRKNSIIYKSRQKDQKIQIQRLSKGDIIQSYNCETGLNQEDRIADTYSSLVTSAMEMTMQNGQKIVCTPNHLFLSESGNWISFQYDQVHQRLEKGSILKTIKGNLKVLQIELLELDQPEVFYHVSVQKNHTFFINGIVSHNMQIFIIYKKQIFTVNITPSQKISSFIKNIINKKIVKQIEFAEIELVYAGMVLQNNKTWNDLKIPKDSYIELVSKREVNITANSRQLQNKTIVFRFSDNQSIKTSYQEVRDMRVHQAISQFHSNPKNYYSLLYGDKILYPNAQINSIQKSSRFQGSQCTLILIKSYQKIAFNQIIPESIVFRAQKYPLSPNTQKLRQQAQKRLKESSVCEKQFINESFYNPIQFYTCNAYYKKVNQFMNQVQFADTKVDIDNDQFAFTASLIKSLKKLPNYMGLVHRGIKNFKFSSFYKQGDSFYWKSFTSTSKDLEIAKKFHSKGTIFHIYSVTGKQISIFSVYQHQKEVIFLPFTYFFVEKIVKSKQVDEVWLSQMPTPVDLKRNLIIWVDDQPINNIKYIMKMKQNADILALTSTAMAKCWMQQFGWLTNWIGIKTRFISDMVRLQKQIPNYQAGIDLLEEFYNEGGLTTPILIFCTDVQKAKETIHRRNISHHGYFRVTANQKQVVDFSNFQVELEGQRKQNVYLEAQKYNNSQKCYSDCILM